MIETFFRKLQRLPAKIARLRHGVGGAVINFHDVGDPGLYVKRLDITISPRSFEDRIAYLVANREVLAFSKFCKAPFARQTAAVTFDDGYRSFLTEALPVLERYRCPVKIYLNSNQVQGQLSWLNKLSAILERLPPKELQAFARTALPGRQVEEPSLVGEYRRHFEYPTTLVAIDTEFSALPSPPSFDDLYLNQGDLKQLSAHPLIEWGSHTEAHLPLEKLSHDQQSQAILGCHDYLKTILGPRLDGFALPFGGARLRQRELAQIVSAIDTVLVTATGERQFYNRVGPLTEIQRLHGEQALDRFKAALT